MANKVNATLEALNAKAASLHAESWKSDPFAYGRVKMELDAGFHDFESHGKHEPGHRMVSDVAVGNISRRKAQVNKEADQAMAQYRAQAQEDRK